MIFPYVGNKSKGWKLSGKRVKRGLFVTAKAIELNADKHACANLLLKVKEQLNVRFSQDL